MGNTCCCCCSSLRSKPIVVLGSHSSGTSSLVQHIVHQRPVAAVPSITNEAWDFSEHPSGTHFKIWDIARTVTAPSSKKKASLGGSEHSSDSPSNEPSQNNTTTVGMSRCRCSSTSSLSAASPVTGDSTAANNSTKAARTELSNIIHKAHGIVYVVDCSERSVGQDDKSFFQWVVANLRNEDVPVFIVANKQDLEGALTPAYVAAQLGLTGNHQRPSHMGVDDDDGSTLHLPNNLSSWTCQPCVATNPQLRPQRILDYFLDGSTPSLFDLSGGGAPLSPQGNPDHEPIPSSSTSNMSPPPQQQQQQQQTQFNRAGSESLSRAEDDPLRSCSDADPMLARSAIGGNINNNPSLIQRVRDAHGGTNNKAYVPLDTHAAD